MNLFGTKPEDDGPKEQNPKDYKLEEGNYLISIRLLEASDLIPRSASGVANPYCVVKVMDKYEKTRTSKKTLSPLWDQNFAFEFPNLKKSDLEAATITFEIFDRQFLIFSESLGRYEIDLTTVYYQKYHQYYMTWFTLADSGDAKQGVQGYVKANIDVLGPNDKPHVNEKITEDSTSQTVVSSKLKQLGHLIIAEVFRGEHIVPMNVTKKTVDAYVKVNYGGCTSRSDYVNETNPTWNEILYLGTMLPNHSKNVQIEVWNRNTIFKDDLIGTSLIPFNSFMGILDLPSMWVNIYGPPLCGIGEKAEEMALHGFKKGSCYRGRVLMRFSSKFQENCRSGCFKMAFRAPEMIIPNPPVKAYFLRIDVYAGQELPGQSGALHFSIGPYLKKTKIVQSKAGIFEWNETIEFNRILLPIDITQIPDLIVYFADEDYETHRKCFFRIKPPKILNRSRKRYETDFQAPCLVKFKEDETLDLVSDDQFSGFVVMRPVLFGYDNPPEAAKFREITKSLQPYQLRIFFYIGRNFPSAIDGGTCNPLIVVRCGNKAIYSSIKRNTLNPEWYEIKTANILAPDIANKDSPALALVVMVYHVDDPDADPQQAFGEEPELDESGGLKDNMRRALNAFTKPKKVLLGRYWLDIDLTKQKMYKDSEGANDIPIVYRKPKWVPIIYDRDQVVEGKILMGYCMVQQQFASRIRVEDLNPEGRRIDMTMFCIGVRNIKRIFADGGFPNFCQVEMNTSTPHEKIEELEDEKDEVEGKNSSSARSKGNNNQLSRTDVGNVNSLQAQSMAIKEPAKLDRIDINGETNLLMTDKIKIENNGLTFNQSFRFRVFVPYNKSVCPVLELFLYHYPLGKKKLFGAGTFSLREPLGWYFGDEDDDDYRNRWRNFFSVGAGLTADEPKPKVEKLKAPKVKAENKLLYMDDLIYELPSTFKSKNIQRREAYEERKQHEAENNKNGDTLSLPLPIPSSLNPITGMKAATSILGQYVPPLNILSNTDNTTTTPQKRQRGNRLAPKINRLDEMLEEKDKEELTEEERKGLIEELFRKGLVKVADEEGEDEEENEELEIIQEEVEKPEEQEGERLQSENLAQSQYIMPKERKSIMERSNAPEGQNQLSQSGYGNKADASKNFDDLSRSQFNNIDQQGGDSANSQFSDVYVYRLGLKDDEEIESLKADISEKNLKYEELFVQPRAEAKDLYLQAKAKKGAKSVFAMFSLKKGFNFFKNLFKKIEYIDFDTDEDEDVDDVPTYLKGRKEFQDDLEEAFFHGSKIIQKYKIKRGNKRKAASGEERTIINYETIGEFKCLFVREDNKDLIPIPRIKRFLTDQLKNRNYIVRLYILKGVGIIPLDGSDDSEIYLTLQLNDQKPLEIKSMYQNEKGNIGKNPEFYATYEYQEVVIPGSAYVKIDVNKKSLIQNQYIGSTIIDLEERLFTLKWQKLDKKPVEKRNIEHPARGSRGRLEMWIDIIRPMDKQPPTVIFPKVQLSYELRVIVWEAKDCVFKDEMSESNDLFGRGCVKRGENWKETDTHWFCRGTGSFNWRWKWEVNLPVDMNKNYGEDRFNFQLWDRDLIASNDLIGEIEINLNDHRMLKKVVARKKPVQMRKRIKGSGLETNQLWYDVYHPAELDEDGNKVSQGKALLSFEVMPKDLTEKFENGVGRSDPNFYPTLPDPVGRFVFDLFSPLAMLKLILGPKLYYKIWCILWCLLFLYFFIVILYYMIPVVLGVKLAQIIA